MLPRAEAPARRLPYTTADMAERLAKKKAEQEAAAFKAFPGGVTKPFDQNGGASKPSWLSQIGNMAKSLVLTPAGTALDMIPYVANIPGVKGEGAWGYEPEDIGTSNFFQAGGQALEQSGRRLVGDVTAIPGLGKDSPSYTADQIRKYGVAEGLASAGLDYGNLALTAAPFVKPTGWAIGNAINDAKYAAYLRRTKSPFPDVAPSKPGSFIDVDGLQGSRLPARIVDSPATPITPATRLAEAQTARGLTATVDQPMTLPSKNITTIEKSASGSGQQKLVLTNSDGRRLATVTYDLRNDPMTAMPSRIEVDYLKSNFEGQGHGQELMQNLYDRYPNSFIDWGETINPTSTYMAEKFADRYYDRTAYEPNIDQGVVGTEGMYSGEPDVFKSPASPATRLAEAQTTRDTPYVPQQTGYRTEHTKWWDATKHRNHEVDELGNSFPNIDNYPNHEGIWVTHKFDDALKYGDDIREVDLTNATPIHYDGDGGYFYIRPRTSPTAPATPATRLAEAQTARASTPPTATRALPPSVQRALPPATTADMAEQLARAQARQTTHFGTVSKEPIDVIQSTEFPRLSPKYVDEGGIPDLTAEIKQAVSFPVYEIGGQKIAFGNPDLGRFTPEFNTQDVQFIPIDPYQITGLPKTSVEGQNFATTMFDAHQGLVFEQGNKKNIGQVSALTYAASRGDNIAMQELQRLANVGKQGMEAARRAETERILSFNKNWSNPDYWNQKSTVQIKLGTAKDGYTEIKRPMGIDDMFLVHQTDYAPTFDANGNIILKPAGDHAPIDPATGKPMVDKISGKPVANPDRDNLHFTLNHLVEGHMWRNSPTGESYVIIVPLRDVLDANPGSLDNLYAIDTFLTPKPGEGLVMPMQSGRVVQGAGAEVSNRVSQALQEVGKLHNQLPEYQTREILGGSHYANTEHIDERIRQVALQELEKQYPEYVGGVGGVTHSNHPSYFAQRFDNFYLEGGRGWLSSPDYWRMSPNQKLRIYDSNTNKYTTGELIDTYVPDYFGL